MTYDLIAIGSGAAGLSAAVYAGRYNMKTLVIGKEFGGETARAGIIWNYPGFKQIDGYDLMAAMRDQAKDLGAEMAEGEVVSVTKENNIFVLTLKDGTRYETRTVLFALGSERKRLGLPNEHELTSKGIHYCATCDGPLYGGKTIAVVGAGDAAVKAINFIAGYAEKIYVLVRGNNFRAEPVNVEEMKRLGDKVTILYETEVKAVHGEKFLTGITLSKAHNGSAELALDGLFVEIGAQPNTVLAKQVGVTLDPLGYIAVDTMMNTNIPGCYGAGDMTNHFGAFKQDITAAALGAVAATSAFDYVKKLKHQE